MLARITSAGLHTAWTPSCCQDPIGWKNSPALRKEVHRYRGNSTCKSLLSELVTALQSKNNKFLLDVNNMTRIMRHIWRVFEKVFFSPFGD